MLKIRKSITAAFSIDEIQLDPGIQTRTSQIQLLYGVWVTMANLAIGLGFGFASVQVPQLFSVDSEITITESDASWIASMLLLFCPIGCMISGFIMDRIGRRFMLIFSQLAMFIGWVSSSLALTPEQILIARAITGVGCGMAMSPPRAYLTEISLPNMRGVLGAFPNAAQSIGITVQAALGKFFHWKLLCYVCCGFTLVISCSFTLLPESPYFILQTKSEEDARASLAKFRCRNYDIDKEMDELIDFKEDSNIRKLTFIQNMRAAFSKAACTPFWLIIIYVLIGQLAGNSCMMFWAVELLVEARSSYDVYAGNILLSLARVFMGIVTSILMYRIGRRALAIISAIGVALVCFILGVYLIYYDEPSLLPLICFILYNAFASIGYYALPHLMAFELLPLQVRGILGGALISLHCLMMFASTLAEPYMVAFLGVDYTFISFGGFSLAGIGYLFCYLPETKDLTLQEIEEYYNEIRPTLVSHRRIITMSQAAMLSSPKLKTDLFKFDHDAHSSKTSRTKLDKLQAQGLSRFLEQGETRSEVESIKSTKSSGSKKSTDVRRSRVRDEKDDNDKDLESIKSTKSSGSKKSTDSRRSLVILDEEDNKDLESIKSTKQSGSKKSTDGKRSRVILDEEDDNDKDLQNIKTTKPLDSRKSMDSRRSRVVFDEEDNNAKDLESIKSTKSSDSKKSQKDEKTKEPKEKGEKEKDTEESSKDGEETPKDKDQASTSMKKTQ